ncbi:MAG TPA: chalcone isomerase family protein [Kofleriaceae bacterium]
MRRVLVLAFLVFFAGTAAAGKLAGVSMPEVVTIDGKPLVLNGMGIRKATIFNIKVYVVGLYLESKSHSAADVLRSEQVKRFDVVLRRAVDRDDIIDAWRKGLKKSGADMAKLKPRFDQFAGWMSDFAEGDTLTFLYVPERGVTVIVKGTLKGTIAGADFATALFAIWLGANPVDDGLKDGLLGN